MRYTADHIIDSFGGDRPMHEATGIPLNTIRSWRKAGVIGSPKTREYEAIILDVAKKRGLPITPDTLVGTHGKPSERAA